MQNPITPIEKIDTVLKLLQEQNSYKTRDEVESILLDSSIIITQDALVRILDKLVIDGYAIETVKDRNGTTIPARYLISWSGHLFDSYHAKSLRDAFDEQQQLEISRLKKLDKTSERNQTRLNRLTLWLAIGTIMLALVEIVKFLCEFDPSIKVFFQRIL